MYACPYAPLHSLKSYHKIRESSTIRGKQQQNGGKQQQNGTTGVPVVPYRFQGAFLAIKPLAPNPGFPAGLQAVRQSSGFIVGIVSALFMYVFTTLYFSMERQKKQNTRNVFLHNPLYLLMQLVSRMVSKVSIHLDFPRKILHTAFF